MCAYILIQGRLPICVRAVAEGNFERNLELPPGSLTNPRTHCLADKSPGGTYFDRTAVTGMCHTYVLSSQVGAVDLNSEPCVCTASSLPNEPSGQPSCKPSISKKEVEKAGIQGHSQRQRELKASLSYREPQLCLKTGKTDKLGRMRRRSSHYKVVFNC